VIAIVNTRLIVVRGTREKCRLTLYQDDTLESSLFSQVYGNSSAIKPASDNDCVVIYICG